MTTPRIRTVGPVRAVLSNFLGLGLGYVYVGRIKLAILFVATVVGLIAVSGWSRLVFEPLAFYGIAAVSVSVGLFVFVHCGVIAARDREVNTHRYNRWWFYLLWIVASWILGEVVMSIRPVMFGFEPFRIPSNSMAPVMQEGDFVMVDTWYFDNDDPQYGDLVVFRLPGNEDIMYLKRVVGLPEDILEIRNDVLIRNGQAVDEPYIRLTTEDRESMRNFGPTAMSDNSYFVLGDNRHFSKDSRFIGPIDRSLMHGRIVHRWFAYDERVLWDRFPVDIKTLPEMTDEDP